MLTRSMASQAEDRSVLRVLIVEDNQEAQRGLTLLLGLWGHEVRVASDGVQALEAVNAATPDVVLLDLGLPRMDGRSVARRLRKHPNRSGMLIVGMTGSGLASIAELADDPGFDLLYLKPLDLGQLRSVLEECSQGKSANDLEPQGVGPMRNGRSRVGDRPSSNR